MDGGPWAMDDLRACKAIICPRGALDICHFAFPIFHFALSPLCFLPRRGRRRRIVGALAERKCEFGLWNGDPGFGALGGGTL